MLTTPSRIQWVDYARGIAIITVVIWHVNSGLLTAGLSSSSGMRTFEISWESYALRMMPVFFFLSGWFMYQTIDRSNRRILTDKLRTIAYPYVVWSIITMVAGSIARAQANSDTSLNDLPQLVYDPILHYWFLFALFAITVLYLALHRMGVNRWTFLAVGLLLYVAGEATDVIGDSYVLGQICFFTMFFALGTLGNEIKIDRIVTLPISRLTAVTIVTSGGLLALVISNPGWDLSIARPLSSAVGLVAALGLAELLARSGRAAVVALWGRYSLEIYLVHVLGLVATRIALDNILGVENVVIHFIAGTLVGLVGPLILVFVVDRIGFTYAFSIPRDGRMFARNAPPRSGNPRDTAVIAAQVAGANSDHPAPPRGT